MKPQHRSLMAFVAVAAVVAGLTWNFAAETSGRYLSVNPSITQRFHAIPSEEALTEYCQRLGTVQGITGVSFRDYSPEKRSALVTIFYDPSQTSVRQVKLYIDNTRMLWQTVIKV
jgi:hypothetical protein